MKLSIIVPAYNESGRIIPMLNNYYTFFKNKLKTQFEIIIIPNNCSDETSEVTKRFASNKKEISVFEIKNYSGKGGAVMKGFELAKGDLVGFVDADKSTSPEEFFKLYSNIEKKSGIIGSRRIKGAKIIPRRKLLKNISSLGFHFIIKILFYFKYEDTQCGAKIFKKDVAKYLAQNHTEKGWIFDINLLELCKKKNYKIKEFPITWTDDDGSHISKLDEMKSLFNVIKYRFTS